MIVHRKIAHPANHQLAWRWLFVFAFLISAFSPFPQKIAVSGRLLTEPWQTGVSGTSTTSYQFDSHTELGPGIRTLASSDSGQSDSVTSQNGFMQVTGETAASGTASSETLSYGYDALGNTTGRTSSVSGAQTLTWDSFGRLVKVAGTNTTWQAVYDGLGRRIRTIASDSVAGTNDTIDSFYDPEVEFLELGVAINGTRTWKLYGPDRSGLYGGAQGIGGLEAVIDEASGGATGVLNNVFGDAVASVDGGGALTWAGAEVGGYGALPGATMPKLGSASSLLAATIWRGHYLDATGFYHLGAREYDPQSGRFLSPDPLGHASSISLYDYANGDPVNGLDPDGRFGKNTLDMSSLSPELQNFTENYNSGMSDYDAQEQFYAAHPDQAGFGRQDIALMFDQTSALGTAANSVWSIATGTDLYSGQDIDSYSMAARNLVLNVALFAVPGVGEMATADAFALRAESETMELAAISSENAASRSDFTPSMPLGFQTEADTMTENGFVSSVADAPENTVIGHLGTKPNYVDVAQELEANYLVPSKNWNFKNQGEFIQDVIERGDNVYIGTPIRPGPSILKKEIKQLIKAGYEPIEQGSKILIKK